jgi:dihydroflavonol-4-reductase
MKPTLVTGANGHIGAHVVRSLLEHGYAVRAFVRPSADLRSLHGLEVEYAHGDIRDAASVQAACQGCQSAVHTAAVYKTWAKNPDDIIQPALAGTRNMLAAARDCRLERVVYTSSIAAIGFSRRPDQPLSEANWQTSLSAPYPLAKTRSEQEAVRLSEQYGVPLVRICPTMVVGPLDYRTTPSMRFIAEMVNTGMFFEGGQNLVDVREVGELHALALEKGEPGGRYLSAGCNLHQRDYADIFSRLTGLTPKNYPNSRPLILLLSWIMEKTDTLAGKDPALVYSEAQESINRYAYVDDSLTVQTFGTTPRPAEYTLRDSVRWLIHLGKITRQIPPHLAENLQPDPAWLEAGVPV